MYHPVYFYECTNAMSYIRKIESRGGGLDENGVILPESEIVKEYNI